MTEPDERFAQAVAQHQSGQFEDALTLYRELLEAQPDRVDALHLLGLLQLQRRQPAAAIASLRRAVELAPDVALYHHHLSAAYRTTGHDREGVLSLRDAARLDPSNLHIARDLSNAERKAGYFSDAELSFRRLLDLQVRNPLSAMPQLQSGESTLTAEALESERIETVKSLASVLQKQEKFDEARAYYEQVLLSQANDVGTLFNLATIHYRQWRLESAEARYRQCAALAPQDAKVQAHLGRVLQLSGKLTDASRAFEAALAIDPEYAVAHYDLACTLLTAGDFARGWPELEWRFQVPYGVKKSYALRRWVGQPLQGERVFVYAEDELEDTLQFVRFARQIEARGGQVLLAVQPSLLPLVSQSMPMQVTSADRPEGPQCQFQVPLLSLPGILGVECHSIPADVPYLRADPAIVELWRARIGQLQGFKIGVHWQGSKRSMEDRREIPIEAFAPLAQRAETTLVALQKGWWPPIRLGGPQPVVDFGVAVDGLRGPLMDTAAILQHLDLVVTCDGPLAHLAGAMGVPVWVALPATADWRWMRGRADSPWYPSMRLFRQQNDGDWSDVFVQMAAELNRRGA